MADKKMLSEFARRASQRRRDRQVKTKFTIHVPSFEQDMEFQTLMDDEVREILSSQSDDDDSDRQDKLTIYNASVSPNLKETASELKEAGELVEYLEIMDMFTISEIHSMAKIILEKSGVMGGDRPRLVEKAIEDLKN